MLLANSRTVRDSLTPSGQVCEAFRAGFNANLTRVSCLNTRR
jgi:hypothetical protein